MEITILRHWTRLKNRLARYQKLFAFLLHTVIRPTPWQTDTGSFIRYSRRCNTKSFFDAKIYTLPELHQRLQNASADELKKDSLRELLETYPLLVFFIRLTREKWVLGKIEEGPFDVFLAPQRLTDMTARKASLFGILQVQNKRLKVYPDLPLSLQDWIENLRNTIVDKIVPKDFGSKGHVHLYNEIKFKTDVSIEALRERLRKADIPSNKNIDSISLTLELTNRQTGKGELATFFIYPFLAKPYGCLPLDIQAANSIYTTQMAIEMLARRLEEIDADR